MASDSPSPFDPYCQRPAADIPEIVAGAKLDGVSPDVYAREDGTFDQQTGQFACLDCYLKLGMPSSDAGWKAGQPVPQPVSSVGP